MYMPRYYNIPTNCRSTTYEEALLRLVNLTSSSATINTAALLRTRHININLNISVFLILPLSQKSGYLWTFNCTRMHTIPIILYYSWVRWKEEAPTKLVQKKKKSVVHTKMKSKYAHLGPFLRIFLRTFLRILVIIRDYHPKHTPH